MPSPLEILNDPNYVNANAATKQAIFEKRVATSPEYKSANASTQAEIRRRFGVPLSSKPRQKGTGVPVTDFITTAANEALIGAVQGAVETGAFFTDPLVGLVYGEKAKEKGKANRRALYEEASRVLNPYDMPVYREAGKVLAPATAVSRSANMLAPVVKKLPAVGNAFSRVAQTTASGGFSSGRTAAEVSRMTAGQRAADMAARVTGGAASGAGTSALMGEDPLSGAAWGAGLPVVTSAIGKIIGKVVDFRSMPKQKAAQIIRDALGDNLDAARAVFNSLSPDDQRLARQVLVEAGVEPRVLMGLGADVERAAPDQINAVLEQQARDRTARLATAAGGRTATEQRAGVEQAARDVRGATAPMREQALSNLEQTNLEAARTNRAILDAERIADLARARADELTASGQVLRMRGLETRSAEQADVMGLYPSFFPEEGALQRTQDIAQKAGNRADAGISTQVGLRDVAREMDDIVAELAAQGREPLRAAPLSSALRQQADAPGVRTSSARRALLKLANQIDGAADANGMLNPHDLYTLRKEASDIVEKYVASSVQPSTGSKKRAASLVISFKNAVDDAMGPEFREYLDQHRKGMEAVNNRELAATGAQLAEKNPNEFIQLMRGNRPDIVEGAMGRGSGKYDINDLALSDPRRYMPMLQSAQELETLNRMAELSRQGAPAAAELLNRERPLLARAVTRAGLSMFPGARIGLEGGETAMAEYLRPRLRQELANAFVSGRNMAPLLDLYPSASRASEGVSRNLTPEMQNVFTQLMTRPVYAEFPEINPETGEILVGIGEYQGQRYPMYGPREKNTGR